MCGKKIPVYQPEYSVTCSERIPADSAGVQEYSRAAKVTLRPSTDTTPCSRIFFSSRIIALRSALM
mgnify:CR=1 FL=1